jgi:threonine synthase
LAAYRQALTAGLVTKDENVVLFNCATGLKYPMPEAPRVLDRNQPINLDALWN